MLAALQRSAGAVPRSATATAIELKVGDRAPRAGLRPGGLRAPTETFSGGWQMRLALAKLLLRAPGLLLLDEPTNHLDLEARNWLEDYLSALSARGDPGLARPLLPRRGRDPHHRAVAAHAHRLPRQLPRLPRRSATSALERLREAKREQDEEIARVQDVHRSLPLPGDQGRAGAEPHQDAREGRAASRCRPSASASTSTFPPCAKSGRIVLELEARAQGVRRDGRASTDLDLHIERGDRIALVGPNGAGKSTLMRMLAGVEAPDAGAAHRGPPGRHAVLRAGRSHAPRPGARRSTRRWRRARRTQMVPAIRNILGGFLFSGDDVYKKAGVLSGGERTRLAVARMLLRPSNTLLLDEPTNHLDLDSKDVLLEALADYGGTLVFVSHDRYFVERLATKIIEVGRRARARLSGHLRGIPLEQGAQAARPHRDGRLGRRRTRAEASVPAARASRPRRRTSPDGSRRPARQGRRPRREQEARRRGARGNASARIQARRDTHRRARSAHRRTRSGDQEGRGHDGGAGVLRRPRAAKPVIDRHQALMWEVGDLMRQWEDAAGRADRSAALDRTADIVTALTIRRESQGSEVALVTDSISGDFLTCIVPVRRSRCTGLPACSTPCERVHASRHDGARHAVAQIVGKHHACRRLRRRPAARRSVRRPAHGADCRRACRSTISSSATSSRSMRNGVLAINRDGTSPSSTTRRTASSVSRPASDDLGRPSPRCSATQPRSSACSPAPSSSPTCPTARSCG